MPDITNTQAMGEELEQNALVSDEDTPDTEARTQSAQQLSMRDTTTIDDDIDSSAEGLEEEDLDAEGDDDYEYVNSTVGQDLEDEDAPGSDNLDEDGPGDTEELDEAVAAPAGALDDAAVARTDKDAYEADEDEGVGAVKIKPGETDDEESDSDLHSSSSAESEGSAAWEETGENDDEDEDDDDDDEEGDEEESEEEEDEDNAIGTKNGSGICKFCSQDEVHDPSEDFEVFLCCSDCGEHAHLQCAREAKAMANSSGTDNWKCPDCSSEVESRGAELDEQADTDISPKKWTSPSVRRASNLEADLLPANGAVKPDSHSMFDGLVVEDDPMDGSRMLRKRKTSPVETDGDDVGMSLRKRRRNPTENDAQGPSPEKHGRGTQAGEESTRTQASRSLRHKVSGSRAVTVQKKTRTSLVIRIRVNGSSLHRILEKKPKPKNQSSGPTGSRLTRPSRGGITGSRTTAPAVAPSFASASYSQPFYSFFDRDMDDLKGKPYGGILTEAEADTQKTLPINDDRRRFDEAKQKAEEEWRSRLEEVEAQAFIPVSNKKSRKSAGPASQIECIQFGGWEIDTWYAAPYPEEYSRNRVLYICEFCLKYMNSDYVAWRHKLKCPAKHPPGDEIYRKGSVSFFEVDGRKNPIYCQNLCLLAKLFLGSKTLYYDVEPFLFYVLCEYDELGYHFVGYFSKEKRASSQNNVSCILTLPIHQRKGYGNLLIEFSYLLTRVEKKTGSPEKPLSDMGLVSYRNYWRLVLCRYFVDLVDQDRTNKQGLSIKSISDDTGLTPDDVISALEGLRFLVRDPHTSTYAFRVDLDFCMEAVSKWEAKKYVKLDPHSLTWTPYVMGRGSSSTFELGPAISTVAPREPEEGVNPTTMVIGEVAESTAKSEALTPSASIDAVIIESTEQGDKGTTDDIAPGEGEPQPNGEGVASRHESIETPEDGQSGDGEDEWMTKYDNIPATRFHVYPPISGTRRAERSRLTINSLVAVGGVKTPSTGASRTVPRRPAGGSARKSMGSKPKASSSRRKTGGTGRGPGRWPKGTKKSDYGNADSGPGFPPGWLARVGKPDMAGKDETEEKTATNGSPSQGSSRSESASSTPRGNPDGDDSIAYDSSQREATAGSNKDGEDVVIQMESDVKEETG